MSTSDKAAEKLEISMRIENRKTHILQNQRGYLGADDVRFFAEHEPQRQILVRCSAGSFVCAAQDALIFAGIINREGSNYVRDISFPAAI